MWILAQYFTDEFMLFIFLPKGIELHAHRSSKKIGKHVCRFAKMLIISAQNQN